MNNELQRLYEWIMDEHRKPAQTFFTAGLLRNVAKEIEYRLHEALASNPKEPETVHGNEAEKERCDTCGCHPSVIYRTEFGKFCKGCVRYV